jgi:hypothetical protein
MRYIQAIICNTVCFSSILQSMWRGIEKKQTNYYLQYCLFQLHPTIYVTRYRQIIIYNDVCFSSILQSMWRGIDKLLSTMPFVSAPSYNLCDAENDYGTCLFDQDNTGDFLWSFNTVSNYCVNQRNKILTEYRYWLVTWSSPIKP